MTYNQLRQYFLEYRAGMMSRKELVAAIGKWQRSINGAQLKMHYDSWVAWQCICGYLIPDREHQDIKINPVCPRCRIYRYNDYWPVSIRHEKFDDEAINGGN